MTFPNEPNQGDRLVIWAFETVQGGCRLGIKVPRDRAQELHGELWGASVVAESFDEFLALASRAIHRSGGALGDLLRQPVPQPPLATRIRAVAHVRDVGRASEFLMKAFRQASPDEILQFLSKTEEQPLRTYVGSVVQGLDEAGPDFLTRIAGLMGRPPVELAELLFADRDDPTASRDGV